MMSFLPICKKDLENEEIFELDFIFVTGDAYVDHPTFACALITRIIQSQGFTVGIIAQPQSDADYLKLGTPKHGFFVSSGAVDSMVNNYTASKKKRSDDVYSEGGIGGKRPDRALTVYCQKIRQLFGDDIGIFIGGIEGSLRRFAHYDYWADNVQPSILISTNATLLSYGMGEHQLFEMLKLAKLNKPLNKVKNIEGTSYIATYEELSKKMKAELQTQENYILLPSYEDVCADKLKYVEAFNIIEKNTDNLNAKGLIQKCGDKYIIQNKPAPRLKQSDLDFVYSLPYERKPHPIYIKGVPAITEVEFSVNSHRGCFGNCSFCALTYHQGRSIQRRSEESILNEVELLTKQANFKGYIHDIGGPSANFFEPSCENQLKCGICKNRQCIGAKPCPNLKVSHKNYLEVLRKAREIKGVKKVFVRSGVRFDYVMMDKDNSFFKELCEHHISGQLKIAPEHICDSVLDFMNKPSSQVYKDFAKKYADYNAKIGKKQYLVPYFISSHPGCTLNNAIELAEYLRDLNYTPLQVQDFYPTPSTRATTAYYTGIDPRTLKPIYVAKSAEDKAMQRALLQFKLPKNYALVLKALTKANRKDLIGPGKKCLINYKIINGSNKSISNLSKKTIRK